MTICSKEKQDYPGLLPAIDMYNSDRIEDVYAKSRKNLVGFRILSGKHGLLSAMDYIANYDKLLTHDGVDELTKKVSNQLKFDSIDEVLFFGKDLKEFPEWWPYYEVIEKASAERDIKLNYQLVK
jgi:hypothetical protein